MKKYNLQIFASDKEVVKGTKIVYLYRLLADSKTAKGTTLAYTTENERTLSRDSDTTETKDGPVVTPGSLEHEITATSILTKGDSMIDKMEKAVVSGETMEIWEADLSAPVADVGGDQFKGKYFQGKLTEFSKSSNAEDNVEISLTFAIEGAGESGNVTVTKEQQEEASYAFKDTTQEG